MVSSDAQIHYLIILTIELTILRNTNLLVEFGNHGTPPSPLLLALKCFDTHLRRQLVTELQEEGLSAGVVYTV